MEIISGWFLIILSFAIPFLSERIRRDSRLVWAILLVLSIKQALVFFHVFVSPLPTVSEDSLRFNAEALEGGFERHFYVGFLRFCYEILGGSLLIGCELGQVVFSLSLIVFVYLGDELHCEETLRFQILAFGLLPSNLLNTSVTLREPYQQFGFLLLAYGLVHLRKNGLTPISNSLWIASAILILFHKGFAPYILAVVPLAILWAVSARPLILAAWLLAVFAAAGFGGSRIISSLSEKSQALQQLATGEGLAYIEKYAKKVNVARSSFPILLDVSSPGQFLKTAPIVFLEYLFSPMPWEIRDPIDVIGVVESSVRIYLFLGALTIIRSDHNKDRSTRVLLLLLFLTLEAVWASGTANWGTAFRHRVVGYGVLVLLSKASPSRLPRTSHQKRRKARRRRSCSEEKLIQSRFRS